MKAKFCKLFLVLAICANIVHAQTWREINPPLNIFNNAISSLATDSLGQVYAAGQFRNTNNEYVVAKWNGQWEELGTGSNALHANNPIACITLDRARNLYAAGGFTNSSGNYYIAKWNDTTWSQVGTGVNAFNPTGIVYTITTDVSNNLYAAGGFTNANGKYYVAKWNGSSWSELGTGTNALNADGLIYSLTTDNLGNVYAAGQFKNSNGKKYVAKWNGTNWTETGASSPLNADDYITCVKTDNSGNVYAAGAFKNSSGDCFVAKYNGSSWTEIGSGANAIKANGPINTLTINATGTIYAAGFGTNLNGNTNVVQWNGTSWTELFNVGYLDAGGSIKSIAIDLAGNVYAGGGFKNNGGQYYVAKWDGTSMNELGRQGEFLKITNGIDLVTADNTGNVYALGDSWSGPGSNDVSKWDGIGWTQMKNSNSAVVENVTAMTTDNAGNVYISGRFVNQNREYYVAKWDGTNWNEVTNVNAQLYAVEPISTLTSDSSNNIYAAGLFIKNGISYGIAKWNGTEWEMWYSIPTNSVRHIVPGPGGCLYVTGTFTNNGKYIVDKVIGNSRTEVGSGPNALNANSWINSLAVDGRGNLYAGGMFTNSSFDAYVAKWDGTTWTSLGSIPNASYITSLAADSSGNVYAAISANANSRFYIAKWNGTSWAELGGPNALNANSLITTIHRDRLGNIYAGGLFNNSNGRHYVAAYGESVLILKQPVLSTSPNEYCITNGQQSIKILNLGDTLRIPALVKLDNTRLNINSDSSFSFNVSQLTPGTHRIKVSFFIGTDSLHAVKDFTVVAAATPDVNVTANVTTVTNTDPVIITATNTSGGGAVPLFTFAKDRNITTILQAESTNSILSLNPTTLVTGDNWIYVRMRSSEICYTTQINVDSIKITRSAVTAITDVDYPNQQINVNPNPFSESLTIRGLQLSKSYSITLVNSLGQVIFQKDISNSSAANIKQSVPGGIYLLAVYDNSKKRLLGVMRLIKN